jgi:glycosyltransferase involved in cell wall biosynthesis
MPLRRILGAVRSIGQAGVSVSWKPYTRLFMIDDSADWILRWETIELSKIAEELGIHTIRSPRTRGIRRQCAFFAYLPLLMESGLLPGDWRLAAAHYHGRRASGDPIFKERFEWLKNNLPRISRLQVTNRAFREEVLESGIEPSKVYLIPLGVNLDLFREQTAESRREARERYGIPQSAVVIGSFQKDGAGWGEGMEPKLIKGPDVFLGALRILRERVKDLFVLLSGPARGFVKKGLEELKIPYRHRYLSEYSEVGNLYHCLDLYLVSSREEGGPKAVLEAMASGVPLVTTRVGQAADLLRHGENGWMVDSEDVQGLAQWAEYALTHEQDRLSVIRQGRATAETNSYKSLTPLWVSFMDGFVSR